MSDPKLKVFFLVLLALFLFSHTFAVAAYAVSIKNSMSVETVQANIQKALDELAPSGGSVPLDGSYKSASSKLLLNIPAGVTLVWTARYEGSVVSGEPLICFSGSGKVEIRNNAVISNSSRFGSAIAATGNVSVTVSRASVTADGFALLAEGGVIVEDGSTISAGARGISSSKGFVMVSGGMVKATEEGGIAIDSASGTVTLSGGIVDATAKNAIAVSQGSGNLILDGSMVYTIRGLAASGNSFRRGIVFTGNSGIVYGNFVTQQDLVIPGDTTLTLMKGAVLTVPQGITLTLKSGSTLNNANGLVSNQGKIKNGGTITDTLNIDGIPFEDTHGQKEGGVFSWF